jgi:hypothetical protein
MDAEMISSTIIDRQKAAEAPKKKVVETEGDIVSRELFEDLIGDEKVNIYIIYI